MNDPSHLCYTVVCIWFRRPIIAALFHTQPLSCWAQRRPHDSLTSSLASTDGPRKLPANEILAWKKKKERRTRAGAPTAVGHGSLLVSRLAARTPSEDLLLWRREPASSLNVSPSSCSRTAQHICFLYNVLLRRSPSFAIFSCTFHPRPSRDCLQLPTGHSCGHLFFGGGGVVVRGGALQPNRPNK